MEDDFLVLNLLIPGASSSRVSVPPISPQGQRTHVLQPGLPVPAFEANLVSFSQYVVVYSKSRVWQGIVLDIWVSLVLSRVSFSKKIRCTIKLSYNMAE